VRFASDVVLASSQSAQKRPSKGFVPNSSRARRKQASRLVDLYYSRIKDNAALSSFNVIHFDATAIEERYLLKQRAVTSKRQSTLRTGALRVGGLLVNKT
jgi:hypothetical protein